jgi:hypothetical protein
MEEKKILVGIASYRDPELLKTIQDCLAKAKRPERVFFAIANQYDQTTRHTLDYFTKEKLKLAQIDHRQTGGLGWARRLVVDLWGDEDFALQIDAHTRFDQGWDATLLQEWQACNDPKAVVSAYPTAYTYDERGQEIFTPYNKVGSMRVEKFNEFIPAFKGYLNQEPTETRPKILGLSGGFQFGPGEIFGISFAPQVCFMGEEFVRAFQLFSYGFNFYAPNKLPLYHLYKRQDTRFWHDLPAAGDQEKARYNEMTKQSYEWVRNLLAGKLENYHLYFGGVRTLQDYEKYLGEKITL